MANSVHLEIELPGDLPRFRLPAALQNRLQHLLDKQEQGQELSLDERQEAEGLVDMADLLSLLRLRAERRNGGPSEKQ